MKRVFFLSLAVYCLNIIPICAQWASNGAPVCVADSSQQDVSAVPDGCGGAIITWIDKRNGTYDIYAQRIDAEGTSQWSLNGIPIVVSSNWKYARLAKDEAGGGIVVWKDFGNLYAQRFNGNGEILWSSGGVPICTSTGTKDDYRIVNDNFGGAIICWADNRNGHYDIFAQKINGQGIIQWTENGAVVCDTAGDQRYPEITADGSGGAAIVWKDNRGGSSSYSNIYAQRINSAGQAQWSIYGLALCTDPLDQWPLGVVGGSQEGFIVAWESNWSSVVSAQRVDSLGIEKWGNYGISIVSSGSVSAWDMATDGLRGAFMAWGHYSNGYNNVKVQHIDSMGIALWTSSGILASTDSGAQFSPRILSDQSGGAIVSWYNFSGSTNYDIYAQRLSISGTRDWSDTGLAICKAPQSQQNIKIITNGQGGAIIAWEDERNGNRDIYAQRVNYNGTIGVEGDPDKLSGKNEIKIECAPNPFRGTATIRYYTPKTGWMRIRIYDAAGHLVKNLQSSFAETGYHSLKWNARDDTGRTLPSGIYFLSAQTVEGNNTTRLLLLK